MKFLLEERLRVLGKDPGRWLRQLGVARGMRVADLGAGKGLYSLVAASIVGPEGEVLAFEPDGSRSVLIERRATAAGLSNIRVFTARAEEMTGVPDSSVDFAISLNSRHHFESRSMVYSEVSRVLKPGGTFYVRDIVWNWLLRHGTRRGDAPSKQMAGLSEVRVKLSSRVLEVRLTKR